MANWPSITRDQVIANAKKGFGSGLKKVWYSQEDFSGDYRADCSGFVCRALGLTEAVAEAHGVDWWGGMNTVSLVTSGALRKIDLDDLKPGDLAGNCGPGTAGDNGHVYVFDRWVNNDPNNSDMWIYEQCGNTRGPIHTIRTWPYPSSCQAYRYAGITDEEEDDMPSVEQFWKTDNMVAAPKDSASYATNKGWTAGNALAEAVRAARSAEQHAAANTAAIKVLATAQGLDPDKVYAAVEAGSKAAVAEALKAGAQG